MEAFNVNLLRSDSDGVWVELRRLGLVQIASNGIMIREKESNSLIADFPQPSIKKLEKISQTIIIIVTGYDRTALKFSNPTDLNQFYMLAVSYQWPIAEKLTYQSRDSEFSIPQLEDPRVQEFVFKLLLSEEFKGFVVELKKLMNAFTSNG